MLLISLSLPACAQNQWPCYQNTQQAYSFCYPSQFKVGRYHAEHHALPPNLRKPLQTAGDDPEAQEWFFRDEIVLVEPELLGSHPLSGIPVGEVATIALRRLHGRQERFTRSLIQPEHPQIKTLQLGKHTVYQLPGYPGPYGDQAFYYLVEAPGGDLLEMVAHRNRFSALQGTEDMEPSGYDRWIEQIIPTLRFDGES